MTFTELSEKAYRKEKLDSFPNLAEKYAYLQLCNLYRDYRNELISKKDAETEKIKIEKEFNENEKKIADYYEVFRKQNEIRGNYNNFITAIEKSTKEEDLLFNSLKFIEVLIQDDSFFDRNYNKIVDKK